MLKNLFKKIALLPITLVALPLGGCDSVMTAIKKSSLHVEAHVNEGIFLSPVNPKNVTAYVRVRNLTNKVLKVEQLLKLKLQDQGVTLVSDPHKATHSFDIAILKVGRQVPADMTKFKSGFGSLGGTVGGALMAKNALRGAGTGFLAGSAAEFAGQAFVDDIYINIMADVQISERLVNGKVLNATNSTKWLPKATGWKPSRSRMMITANKVNLKYEDAKDELEEALAQSVAGFL